MKNRLSKSQAAGLAQRLATRRIANGDFARTKALMQEFGLGVEAAPVPHDPEAHGHNKGRRVGIWKPEWLDGKQYYVRDKEVKADWFNWAKVHKIPPGSGKTRIVFTGESVARGYLYDPYYTPAAVLETVLNTTGGMNTEVIDLARTSLGLDMLEDLLEASVALDPDAFVIFAGNNWMYRMRELRTESEHDAIREAYATGGFALTKKVMEEKCRQPVIAFLQMVSAVAAKRNIPVIFIIPEFNLRDWKSNPLEQSISFLPGRQSERWVQAREEGRQALAAGDFATLEASARVMTELDGSNPLGFEWLGTCLLRQEKWEEARQCFELGRDTAILGRISSKPRMYSVLRRTLLEEAGKYGIHLIDLPEIFKTHLSGGVPGCDLFLDYCHLSAEGIRVAMAAAAQSVTAILAGKAFDWRQLIARDTGPDDEATAVAHLCAAMHNAHCGQPYEIIHYHCRAALAASPVVIERIVAFTDTATRKAPTLLCQSFMELVKADTFTHYEEAVGFLHGKGRKLMDLNLVEAMVTELERQGIAVRERVNELRIREHEATDGNRVNLLESFYGTSSYDPFLQADTVYTRVRDIYSSFYLIARKSSSLFLQVTYRTPGRYYPDAQICVKLNGMQVAQLPMSEEWINQSFVLPEPLVNHGINTLTLQWPCMRGDEKLPDSAFLLDALSPALGELYVLEVHKGSPAVEAATKSTMYALN
jgi:hypothetical protein